MKRLDRYILKLFAGALASTSLFLVGLYLILHFLAHVKHHDDARVTFAEAGYGLVSGLCRYYLLHLPEILTLFGPYALLFAAMFALHHLEQGNELVPMRALGLSRLRLTLPIFIGTAMVVIGLVLIKEVLIPQQAREMISVSRLMRGKSDPIYDRIDLLADSRGNVFQAENWDGGRLRLLDVTMLPAGGTRPMHFEYLTWIDDGQGGGRFDPAPGSELGPEDFAAMSDLDPHEIGEENRVLRRTSWPSLREISARNPGDQRLAMLAAEHLAYPAGPFVLLLMGIPLVTRGRRKNVFAGLLLCLGLSLGFFSLSLLMSRLGAQSDLVSPMMAAWLPVIICGSIGLLIQEFSR